jgi:hypothetical protein
MENPTTAQFEPSPDKPSKHRTRQVCPRCGRSIHRTHRRSLDRLASLIVPLQRYRCGDCGWSGLHVSSNMSQPKIMWFKNTTRLALIVAALVLSVAAAVLITTLRFPVR